MTGQDADYDRDLDHLKLLRIFHYIVGGLTIAFSSLFIFHIGFAVMLYLHPELLPKPPGGQPLPPPREMWLLLAIMASVFVVIGWTFGVLTIVSGRMMAQLRHRVFSVIVAGLNCLLFPFGTALGVCTLLVLCRDSVRRRYAGEIS